MDEYAGSRTNCVCRSATTLPTTIVAMAMAPTIGPQKCASDGNPMYRMRRRPTNPAAFEATERYAASGVGDPSYVSGAQKWNGTADTLKPKAATMKTSPVSTIAGGVDIADTDAPIFARSVVPVAP